MSAPPERDLFLEHFLPGDNPAMHRLRGTIALVNRRYKNPPHMGRSLLLIGETGVGKNHLARVIAGHLYWLRDPGCWDPAGVATKSKTIFQITAEHFQEVSLPNVPSELIESELFGHVKGAFTGATADKEGFFGADGVEDLLLDEVGEASGSLQAKLLQVLNDGSFRRVFTSPDSMTLALQRGTLPPHAVIYDWEYPGSTDEKNRATLERLLSGSFAYVQIYTHLGAEAIEPKVSDLRERYWSRLLTTRAKAEVRAAQLAEEIRGAWTGTIAGELADSVRSEVVKAVERTLIDICTVPKAALAALTHGATDNFVQIVLSKVRDELGPEGSDAVTKIVDGSYAAESDEAVRKLLSVWYYSFPNDKKVRRGDLIELADGDLGLVVTPPCDLVRFPKKTGRRLTWLRALRIDDAGVKRLRDAGIEFEGSGNSVIAAHGKAGETIVVLPNVPTTSGSRAKVADYVVLCHGWESELIPAAPAGALLYDHVGKARRCTLADPFASAIVAKVTSVISSPGTPDLPKGEIARLKPKPKPAAAPPVAAEQAAAPTAPANVVVGQAAAADKDGGAS